MDLDDIWNTFIALLQDCEKISSAAYKKYAGIPFLMVKCTEAESPLAMVSDKVKHASAMAMKGKRLHSETVFVRKEQEQGLFIFRHRFYVPQKKMFCCGNMCTDCIRFQ